MENDFQTRKEKFEKCTSLNRILISKRVTSWNSHLLFAQPFRLRDYDTLPDEAHKTEIGLSHNNRPLTNI